MDRRTYLAGILSFPVLGLSGCFGANGPGGGDGGEATSSVPTTREHEIVTHDVDESFTVSDDRTVRYRVLDAAVQERVGGDGRGEEANGLFLVVTLEMENVGTETFNVTDRHLRATNNRNQEFEADFDASAFAGSDPRIDAEGVASEHLAPGQSVTRAVLFDISTGDGYSLKIEHAGVFAHADEHYVLLGNVRSDSFNTPISR